MTRLLRRCIACSVFALVAAPSYAQISFTTAIALALKSNPKVLWPRRTLARSGLPSAACDAYILNIVGGPGSVHFHGFRPVAIIFNINHLRLQLLSGDYLRAAPGLPSANSTLLTSVA